MSSWLRGIIDTGEEGSCYRSWLGWACMSFDRGFVENGGGKGGVVISGFAYVGRFVSPLNYRKGGVFGRRGRGFDMVGMKWNG